MANIFLLSFFLSALFVAHVRSDLYSCGTARYDPTKVIIPGYSQLMI